VHRLDIVSFDHLDKFHGEICEAPVAEAITQAECVYSRNSFDVGLYSRGECVGANRKCVLSMPMISEKAPIHRSTAVAS
jgi:hypothetical protein